MRSQMANNNTEFMGRESHIDGDREVMKPVFGFLVARAHVNVGGLAAFVGIEEGPIRAPAQNGWHNPAAPFGKQLVYGRMPGLPSSTNGKSAAGISKG